MQAVSHPLRSDFLRLLATEVTLSPKRAYGLLPTPEGISLSQINYHVWSLERGGLIELTKMDDRKAGVAYVATPLGVEVMAMIGAPPMGGAS